MQSPEPAARNGVSAVARRRTGFAIARAVSWGSLRGVDPVVAPVSAGLSPVSSLVSYLPAPARVPPHIARFAPYIQSPGRSRVSGACRESTFLSASLLRYRLRSIGIWREYRAPIKVFW